MIDCLFCQEHVVHILVKLLSPPIPTAFTEPGSASHLISHMPILGSILFGVSRVELVPIFSLFGMVSRALFCKACFYIVFTFLVLFSPCFLNLVKIKLL